MIVISYAMDHRNKSLYIVSGNNNLFIVFDRSCKYWLSENVNILVPDKINFEHFKLYFSAGTGLVVLQ